MARFNKEHLDGFLGSVRKYMQMRGGLSQKDLAELTDTGVSTMSRFLNKKTQDLDEQLIAKIVAKLEIPMHEIIDFVSEAFNDRFLQLVKFYKGDTTPPHGGETAGTAQRAATASVKIGGRTTNIPFTAGEDAKNADKTIGELLKELTPRQRAYLTDFLHLDGEGKDLMVDLGNSLFRYFRQKGMEF